ncbi:DUF4347 domain-containing protein, partial [Phormidium sp. CCY1219]|uniref:DUF4347 domain-containing protein n=1 Tax=Phormidium sp. CCY1219 TaxID=2886104 RepID=UPI002D1F4567
MKSIIQYFAPISNGQNNVTRSLVFIDSQLQDYETLVAGVKEDIEVAVIDGDRDGIEQISTQLSTYAKQFGKLDAIHIISHGSSGCLQLGNSSLNLETLPHYKAIVQQWRTALSQTAEILLYGCQVAAELGTEFIEKLATLTQAKIAASENLIGSAEKGGNWKLNFTTGEIKTPLALNSEVMEKYAGVFATLTVTNANDSGAGSLRNAISTAQPGDTIAFDSSLANQTITLTSGQLLVDKDLTIDGANAAGLTISGNNASRIIDFTRDASFNPTSLTVRNLTLANGKTTAGDEEGAGAGIRTGNGTTLTVENTTFRNNDATYGGGGIFGGFQSTTTVINSTFDGNIGTAGQQERGGGAISIKSESNLTVRGSEFTNNKGVNGGAINSLFTVLTVEDSTFINNEAITPSSKTQFYGLGGAILTDGATDLSKPDSGTILVRNSRFEGNRALDGGGANLYSYPDDKVVVEDSLFIRNEALETPAGGGSGGGLRHDNSEFTLSGTSFVDNVAHKQGGGLWVDKVSPTTISNSTFSGNKAEDPDDPTRGLGGGIFIQSPSTLVNLTVTENSAGGSAGALFAGQQQNITVANSVFANNTVGNAANSKRNTNIELTDGGNNLQFPDKNSPDPGDVNVTASIAIADPKLGALQEINGRLVHPLLPGS